VGFNHSVGSPAGIRWYEIQNPNGTPTVAQQGTFSPDSSDRWMGSTAMDSAGDQAIGYSVVNASGGLDPTVRFTGRTPSDPAGTMEAETNVVTGTGVQQATANRWGDYSAMQLDPVDDCTFWFTEEYIKTTGSFNWSTRIANFKFPNCGITTPDFSLSATPSSQTVNGAASTTYTATVTSLNGFSGTVGLTVSGCPSNTTCTLNPTSVTVPPTQNSTLTVQTTTNTPSGSYTLTITGTSGGLIHTTAVTLIVIVPDFSITATPSSQTIAAGGSVSYTAKLSALNGFSGTVALTVSGCPSNTTCTLSTTSVKLPPSQSSTLAVHTTSTTPGGTYTLMITGTSGSLVHPVSVTLVVKAPDFSITSGTSFLRIKAGGKASYGLTLTPLLGFNGSVSLTVTGVPSNSSGTFTVNPVKLTYPKTGKSTLTVSTTTTTPVGTYTLTITGTSGSLTHSVHVTLVVT
jgi:hypothetical protein